ncbi:5-(carboxyamino)imidazole ribonucleotide synthase [Agaribacterium sp. ZY112]|uniref:5-(carboxyamino)imidazole ribonucleotide synthase n=1 Tax=Agaribacterium sp. ZY112 TaxID=3233574 RepID=UPI003524462F
MHIAIIGCGQLARMMALDGWRMGLSFSFLANPGESRVCVDGLGSIVELEQGLDGEALFNALGQPEVVTVEREHVDTVLLASLADFCRVCPNPKAIEVSQHRGREKSFVNSLGIETAPFELANSLESLKAAVAKVGLPVIIKTCGEGYDGKGQWKIDSAAEFEANLAEIDISKELIVEKVIRFEKEVSVISVRSVNGETAVYPITENEHHEGILVKSIAPAELTCDVLSAEAKRAATLILEALDYVGVLSIEFFVVGDKLLVNELAPRVHNSGHWTQAGDVCSQFENHLRGICDMVLGATEPSMNVAMVNLLGFDVKTDLLTASNMQLHSYNKTAQPKRKVGHLNLWGQDREKLCAQVEQVSKALYSDH